MAKLKAAEGMDELQSRLRSFLREHGFRVQSRTCNRTGGDGLTHVINFQMGRFDPPGTNFIPWFRESRYGKFTVNLGVYVPEVALAEYNWVKSHSFVQEAYCCIRTRLGQIAGESDLWWDLPPTEATAGDLRSRFERDAFPFFARLDSRDFILRELEEGRGSFAPRIPRAIVLAARGQAEKARELLKEQIESSDSPRHCAYVREIAVRIGLGQIDL